eukprot:6833220-Prymnesium_polylepis.1
MRSPPTWGISTNTGFPVNERQTKWRGCGNPWERGWKREQEPVRFASPQHLTSGPAATTRPRVAWGEGE